MVTNPSACVVGSTDQTSFLPFHLKLEGAGAGLLVEADGAGDAGGGAEVSGAADDGGGAEVSGAADDGGGDEGSADGDADGEADGEFDVPPLLLHEASSEKHSTSASNTKIFFFISLVLL